MKKEMLYIHYLTIELKYDEDLEIRKYKVISNQLMTKEEIIKKCYINPNAIKDIIDFKYIEVNDPVIISGNTLFEEEEELV